MLSCRAMSDAPHSPAVGSPSEPVLPGDPPPTLAAPPAPATPWSGRLIEAFGHGSSWRRAALAWALVALLAALLEQSQIAWGWTPPGPALGAGRLLGVFRLAARLGAFALPLLALAARLDERPEDGRGGRPLGWAFALWNLGLLVGAVGILAGFMRPEPWGPQPLVADLGLLAGAALWLRALWMRQDQGLDAPGRAALLGGIGLVSCLALGSLLVQALGGLGQALGGALLGRGIDELGLLPLLVSCAARRLPDLAGQPLYGRQSFVWGLWGWLLVAGLGLPADLAPELLGPGSARWLDLLRPWGLLPLGLIALCLAGTFLGRPVIGDPARRAIGGADRLFLAGLAWALALRVGEAALSGTAWRLLQFSPAAPRAWELPAWGAWWCIALALLWPRGRPVDPGEAGRGDGATATGGRPIPAPRRFYWGGLSTALVAFCALFQSALALPLALAQGAAGSYGSLFPLEASLRLPLLLGLMGATSAILLIDLRGRVRRPGAAPADPVPDAAPRTPGPMAAASVPQLYPATVAAVLVATFLTAVLLPLLRFGAAAGEGAAAPGDLAPGQAQYIADGCVFCHSRRQREVWDEALFGPATGVPVPGAPALAGLRRAGPDLHWVGERLQDAPERLAVHAAGGRPALPWRFSVSGAGPEGEDLLDYLLAARPPAAGGR